MEEYRFSVPIQVRMSDLDPFVHANNGAQCNYLDYGRGAYFEHLFKHPIDWKEMDLVLVHLEIDFKHSIEFHDAIVCDTKIVALGNKSMKMMQQLRDTGTGIVKTTSYCVLSGFDRVTHTSKPISEASKQVIRSFEHLQDD